MSTAVSRREFLRQGAVSGVGVLLSPHFLVAQREGMAEPTFADIQGTDRVRQLLEDAFSIYSGRPDANTLSRIIICNATGRSYFYNDNVWWPVTDSQCNYHGTYGWRPFFNRAY